MDGCDALIVETRPANVSDDVRPEISRLLARAVASGSISTENRTYLAQLVAQRSGIRSKKPRNVSMRPSMPLVPPPAITRSGKSGLHLMYSQFMPTNLRTLPGMRDA